MKNIYKKNDKTFIIMQKYMLNNKIYVYKNIYYVYTYVYLRITLPQEYYTIWK